MKQPIILLAGICILFFGAGPAMAGPASAKFAATWGESPALSVVVDTSGYTSGDTVVTDSKNGFTFATIKVPQAKELLIGISAEIGIVTNTSIKGKEGGTAKALADGEAYVVVKAVPKDGGPVVEAKPGTIMLSKRVQELSATLGGVLQACIDTGTFVVSETGECTETLYDETCTTADGGTTSCPDGQVTIPCECTFTDEEIGLLLETTAAHHFNFLLPDMNQGVYDITAYFTTGARVKVDICEVGEECSYDPDGTASASAMASAIINKYMLTIQQVHAAKGTLSETDIIPQ